MPFRASGFFSWLTKPYLSTNIFIFIFCHFFCIFLCFFTQYSNNPLFGSCVAIPDKWLSFNHISSVFVIYTSINTKPVTDLSTQVKYFKHCPGISASIWSNILRFTVSNISLISASSRQLRLTNQAISSTVGFERARMLRWSLACGYCLTSHGHRRKHQRVG